MVIPTATAVASPSATFTYNGGSAPNNLLIDSWINDPSSSGTVAIGQTLVLPQNATCGPGTQNYPVPLATAIATPIPSELQVNAAVGYTNAVSAAGHLETYTVDTGSTGLVVSAGDLPKSDGGINTLVIGPAGPGVKCYDSSNNAYFGNYYLAPVSIQVQNGGSTTTVQTNPIMILAASQYCKVNSCQSLTQISCSTFSIHYMGVGFDRGGTASGDSLNSPTENAFINLTDANNGVDINQGYILSENGITLGINSTAGFNMVSLSASPNVPGDWLSQPACYSFPGLPPPNQFCGTGLLDVGINEMFIDLPKAQWPPATYEPGSNLVLPNLAMSVQMGSPSPAMSYNFTTLATPGPSATPTPEPAVGPGPTYTQWFDTTATGGIFVNAGRDPLNCYNYMFAAQCGQVGFQNISSTGACSGAR